MRQVQGEQNLADHLTKGTKWREIADLIGGVGGRMKVSQGYKGWRTRVEGKALTAATSRETGRARAVREVNIPHGDEGADEWNMTSSDRVTVAAQRNRCTEGQPEAAQRQRQQGKQAQ